MNLPDYYVWCDGSCDNKTNDITEAVKWMREFIADGRDSYIVDVDNNIVEVPDGIR